jgi:hypothetical protein
VEYQGISHWQAILHDIHSFIEMTCAQCWLLGSSVLKIGIFSMMISPSAGYFLRKWCIKSSDAKKPPCLHKDAAPDRPERKTGKASLAPLAAARAPDVYE